ncbi:hypothetical protein SAMN05216302_10141 [Nitrosomonas aestuarii]|uniref:Uncharacterized protein n=1 Tax=Nitrosomonas aestuarii TaxID=52441 RepID=A0A1I4C0F9_9PROT|nr:hypothetical protein [Nitrosomonas aestuarii]SFK73631.1 hypothetical protein SAMN05216302_10141 [Nitrosomonas aestuarii]
MAGLDAYGPLLIALPFIFGFANEEIATNFYIVMGVVVIVVGMLTNYQEEARHRSGNGKVSTQ